MTATSTLVCIVGPTAVGKTVVGVKLAKQFDTVVLSADSRQFYREMNIGTAKPSVEELATIPHYFIDSRDVADDYSAGDFERDALALLDQLFAKHRVVMLVGGSGLFVDAVCRGLDELPKPLPGVRERLNNVYREQGLGTLQTRLKSIDPIFFKTADIQNPQRVIRALEVYESSGKPLSQFHRRVAAKRRFNIVKIGLVMERELLYHRINNRVDAMMDAGLLEEVRALYPHRDRPPLQTVGYAELFDYLDGSTTLQQALAKIRQNTRRYAKRQLTWFRKDTNTHWFAPDEVHKMVDLIDTSVG